MNGHPKLLLLAIVLSTLAFVGGLAYAFVDLGDQVSAIDESRRQAILVTCAETNERHDNTIAALDALIAMAPPGPRRERARASRASTVLLIDALVPKYDCEQRAQRLTRP
jgi:hypothetical protein